MGLYIPKMTLPKDGRFASIRIMSDGRIFVECLGLSDGTEEPPTLKAVEIKAPHGALIDRDALMDEMKPRWDCMDDHDFADKGVWQAFAITPTVIEAEVE